MGPIYYRKDRINKLNTKLNIFPITENMIWEDNPYNKNYNNVNLNNKSSEHFLEKIIFMTLLVVIKYNVNPVVPGKGSAIFIHIAKNIIFLLKDV